MARSRASALFTCWCNMMASMICAPTVRTGSMAAIGSWKTIEMWLPRMARISWLLGLSLVISITFDVDADSVLWMVW